MAGDITNNAFDLIKKYKRKDGTEKRLSGFWKSTD